MGICRRQRSVVVAAGTSAAAAAATVGVGWSAAAAGSAEHNLKPNKVLEPRKKPSVFEFNSEF